MPNGTDQEVFHYYGMDTEGLKEKIRTILQKNKNTMTAYNVAVSEEYRFFSFGDSMMII